MQSASPASENSPSAHATNPAALTEAHEEPAGQGRHTAWLPAEYVPAAHGTSVFWSVNGHAEPAAQGVHDPSPSREYVPGAQSVVVDDVGAPGQAWPAGHCVHTTEPARA